MFIFSLNVATTANYVLDLVAIGVILFLSVRALKKGFVGCLFSFLSTVLSVIIAFAFAKGLNTLTDGFFGVQTALNSEILSTLVSGIVLFLGCKIVFFLLRTIVTAMLNKIPVVGKVNRILGFLVGVIEGCFLIFGVLAILSLIQIEGISAFFSDCLLLDFMFHKNPIFSILSWIVG